MMTYEFRCQSCNLQFEVRQPIHEEHKAKCPKCGGLAQRLYHAPAHYYDKPKPLYHKDGSYEEK